jgi:hypothetical protein
VTKNKKERGAAANTLSHNPARTCVYLYPRSSISACPVRGAAMCHRSCFFYMKTARNRRTYYGAKPNGFRSLAGFRLVVGGWARTRREVGTIVVACVRWDRCFVAKRKSPLACLGGTRVVAQPTTTPTPTTNSDFF